MGYWTEVKEVVQKGINLAGEGIKEGAEAVLDIAKDGVHTVELRKDLFLKQREYHTLIADLGEIVIDLNKEDKNFQDDDGFKQKLAAAKEKEAECRKLEEEIKKSKAEEK